MRMMEIADRVPVQGWTILLILAVSFFTLFFGLANRSLWFPDELRYAQVTKEMVNSGDWVIPRLEQEAEGEKPPLFFWLTSLTSKVRGEIGEFDILFPSALAGLGGVIATFILGRRMYGLQAGFMAGLILATSAKYIWQSRIGEIDTLLAFFITLALLFFYLGYQTTSRSRHYYLLVYLWNGLAVLSKGPVGLVLPWMVIFIFLAVRRELKRLLTMELIWGPLIFLAVAGSWYGAVGWLTGRELLAKLLLKENVTRYLNAWDNIRPMWHYLRFVWDFLPWSPFFLLALFRRPWKEKNELFLLVWFGVIFIFFTLAMSKRAAYLIPLYPAASLLTAKLWQDLLRRIPGVPLKPARWVLGSFLTLTFLMILSLAVYMASYRPAILMAQLWKVVPLMVGITGAVLSAYWFFKRGKGLAAFNLLVGAMTLGVILAAGFLQPQLEEVWTFRPLAQGITNITGPTAPLRSYGRFYRWLAFYSDRPLGKTLSERRELALYLSSAEPVYLVISKSDFYSLMADLDLSPFRVELFNPERGLVLLSNQASPNRVSEQLVSKTVVYSSQNLYPSKDDWGTIKARLERLARWRRIIMWRGPALPAKPRALSFQKHYPDKSGKR